MKQSGNVGLGLVNGRHDDVAGRFAGELDDEFAHVAFHRLDTLPGQIVVEAGFLAHHRLAFYHQLPVPAGDDAVDQGVGLGRSVGPVHLDAVAGQAGFQRFQQFGQPRQTALADGLSERAQAVEFAGIGELRRPLHHQEIHGATE